MNRKNFSAQEHEGNNVTWKDVLARRENNASPPQRTQFINWQLRFNEWRSGERSGGDGQSGGGRLDTTVARNNVFAER